MPRAPIAGWERQRLGGMLAIGESPAPPTGRRLAQRREARRDWPRDNPCDCPCSRCDRRKPGARGCDRELAPSKPGGAVRACEEEIGLGDQVSAVWQPEDDSSAPAGDRRGRQRRGRHRL